MCMFGPTVVDMRSYKLRRKDCGIRGWQEHSDCGVGIGLARTRIKVKKWSKEEMVVTLARVGPVGMGRADEINRY